ncbi:MAG: DMT family transporter [Spirochaetales bacterium]|uniref:DMT family transporter n=1 Tax=Candidatus Thalassospirochaeta sargassi TaxID=3119039 RepID=A0AAJ1IDL2_9SPIO|nr:DMT family transporter [Spirochaetales bacterium]
MTGQLLAVLTAFCWAQNSVFYSFAGKRVTSPTVTHIRLWIAFPAVTIVHKIFLGSFMPVTSITQTSILLAVSGFVGFFVADILIFYGLVSIGPGRTLLILTLSPILSAAASFFILGETLGPLQIAGMLITIGGILVVIYNENRIEKISTDVLKGIIIAVLGAVAQAAAMVLSKAGIADGIHPISANVVRIAFGFGGLIIYSLFRGEFVSDFKKMKDMKALSLIAVAALIGPVLGIIMTLYALQLAPVGIVTTLTQISPVILLPVEAIFLGRKITGWILTGTFTAVAGAVLLFMF